MQINNGKVSVIIPVWNAHDYIRRCVDSIVNQTYENLEILLVDDGSTDDSLQICREYEEKDARIRVFHKENGGQGSARNLALDHCTGEYITMTGFSPKCMSEWWSLFGSMGQM